MKSQSNEIILENTDYFHKNENKKIDNSFALSDEITTAHAFKKTSLSDVITIQCILCIILAILAVAANIFLPKITEDIISEYNSINSPQEKTNSEINSFINRLKNANSTNAEI